MSKAINQQNWERFEAKKPLLRGGMMDAIINSTDRVIEREAQSEPEAEMLRRTR